MKREPKEKIEAITFQLQRHKIEQLQTLCKQLAEALSAGRIAGAAVDVVSAEPIKADNPLLKAPHCLITPHIAWATLEARRRLMQTTAENVAAYQAGRPIHVVNA